MLISGTWIILKWLEINNFSVIFISMGASLFIGMFNSENIDWLMVDIWLCIKMY